MLRFFPLFLLLLVRATADEVHLTLANAPALALRQNPTLAAARLRLGEARGRLVQSGRLSNPTLQTEFSRNARMPEGSIGVELMQSFPLTARLRLEKAITRAELAAAEAEVRDAERKLAADVSTAAVRLLALAGQRVVRERQITNSRELAGFTRQRVEIGEASAVDASLLDLEAQQLQIEVAQLDVEQATSLANLRVLLGTAPSDTPVLVGSLPAVASVPTNLPSPLSRPDFQAAQRTIESTQSSAALARAQKWQDLTIGLNVSGQRMEDAPDGYENDAYVGLRFSLPLPFWNKNEGRIQEAVAVAARAQKESDALALTINAEARSARDSMALLQKLVTSLEKELLPKAGQIEEQLRTSYSSGQGSLLEVLRARDRRLLIERQRVDALRDYHLARIRFAAATGTSLPAKPAVSKQE